MASMDDLELRVVYVAEGTTARSVSGWAVDML